MRIPFSPASLPTFVVEGVFDDSYSNRSDMESVGFRFAFPLWPGIVSIFSFFFFVNLDFFL
jgi:hypothetical protein